MFYEIKMAIGHHRSDDEPLPRDRVETAKKFGLSKLTHMLSGGWVIDGNGGHKRAGQCLFESCSLLTAYTTEVGEDEWAQLLIVASEIATQLEQESVLITIQRVDGTMLWVKPDASTREWGEQAA